MKVLGVLSVDGTATMDQFVAACGFPEHLSLATKRSYVHTGLHWARIAAKDCGGSIIYHAQTYIITDDVTAGLTYELGLLNDIHTRVLTAKCNHEGIPSKAKAWKQAEKNWKRYLEDLEEAFEPA